MVGIVRKKSRRLPKKVGYTGLTPQAQPQGQRGGYKAPTPTSRESSTQNPVQPDQNSGMGFLGNALAGKEAVDGIGKMYEGGKDLKEGFSGLGKAYDKTKGYLGNAWDNSMLGEATSGLSMPDFDMSMPDFFSGGGGSAMPGASVPSDFGIANGSHFSLGGEGVGLNSSFGGGEMSGLLDGSEGMGSLGGSEGMGSLGGDATGLQGGTPIGDALPYLNIGKDLIMGTDNLTGDQYGDAALRTTAAYATGGLSELGYAVGGMFDWW